MDTPRDFINDRLIEEREEQRLARINYCDRDCISHDENCPYYDAEEESWDVDRCFEESEWEE